MSGRYHEIILKIFDAHHSEGTSEFVFDREEIVEWALRLDIDPPKNLGDLIYSFRYRSQLPKSIREKAPEGKDWIITSAGRSKYRFQLVQKRMANITADRTLPVTKVPDSTPGIIVKYALSDEQALLARLRYNRLIDIFTGTACYSLQNHLRTGLPKLGQIETDEVYVGVDRGGVHYVYPVQAKGGKDMLSVVQIDQDMRMCAEKFPDLVCRPIGAQFMKDETIALFAFTREDEQIRIEVERHYRLVPAEDLTAEDLRRYSRRPTGS